MFSSTFWFWITAFAGSVAAGWWLAVRPGPTKPRDLAVPVSFLVILMAALLCVMAITGQDTGQLIAGARHMVGR